MTEARTNECPTLTIGTKRRRKKTHVHSAGITTLSDRRPQRRAPAARRIEQIGMQGRLEPVDIPCAAHRLETLGHAFGITMLAALRDLDATRYRVPGHLGPLDI